MAVFALLSPLPSMEAIKRFLHQDKYAPIRIWIKGKSAFKMSLPNRQYSVPCRLHQPAVWLPEIFCINITLFAPIAYPPISIPSIKEWGSPSMMLRSIKAPGSPSSALQTIYFSLLWERRPKSHFSPVGNPAPPRPRSPDSLISRITSSPVIWVRAFAAAKCRLCYIGIYAAVIQDSAVPKCNANLFPEKADVINYRNMLLKCMIKESMLCRNCFIYDMRFYNISRCFRCQIGIKNTLR